MTKVKIVLDLKTCKKCPNLDEREGQLSPDSFEAPNFDWYCKVNGQKIRGYVEWHELRKIPVPDWCPCLETPIEPNNLPFYKCCICNDTGVYNYGGSFGGSVTVARCPCGGLKNLKEE